MNKDTVKEHTLTTTGSTVAVQKEESGSGHMGQSQSTVPMTTMADPI